jgi:hypothetical protein
MMNTKRVILANGSRLIREMLHHALAKADHLEVVQEVPDWEGLPLALKQFDPSWVIVAQPYDSHPLYRIDSCMEEHPSIRFVFLSPNQNNIKMKWQSGPDEDFSDLSLREFIHILQKDRQPT